MCVYIHLFMHIYTVIDRYRSRCRYRYRYKCRTLLNCLKVGLAFVRNEHAFQRNLDYKAFHRVGFCGNKSIVQ